MSRQKRVAALIGTAVGWGRDLIRGISSYAHSLQNWHVLVDSITWPRFPDHVPRGLDCDGVIALVVQRAAAQELSELRIPVVNVATPRYRGTSSLPWCTTRRPWVSWRAAPSRSRLAFLRRVRP